jgi:hypothetical protein
VKSQTFRFDGSKFTKAKEVAQAGATTPSTSPTVTVTTTTTTEQRTPPVIVQQAPTLEQLVARYRSDRGLPAGTRPRVALALAGNHVALFGRDLVLYGPGYKGGTSYAFLTLSQFADAADVQEVTVRDPYIVVRGIRRVNAQSAGTFDVEMTFLYTLRSDVLTRVFGIESARSQGSKRIQGGVELTSGSHGLEVVVHPGRVQGWTQQTYPFAQDQPGSGNVEPLLLPWGGIPELHYTDNGSAFGRVSSP